MPAAPAHVLVSLAQDVLARGERLWVREASASMLPLVRPGDELLLAPLGGRRIGAGTLIAYERDAELVIHRVVAASGSGVVTKGDALASPDPLVPWERVVARVVALRGLAGRLVNLEAFPWPLLDRWLGAVASLASGLRLGERPSSPWRRLAWKALRVPFYLARLVLR
ncbi:MAG: hypothetical protein HYU24_06070 [Candidatus Rokubacteria bacterium]|nr:hypothetical protein [Candidatus Rokubacteria bacterium]